MNKGAEPPETADPECSTASLISFVEDFRLSQELIDARRELQAFRAQLAAEPAIISFKPSTSFPDVLTVRRVANGWVVQPGKGTDEYTHVATTPDDLARHVTLWATYQVTL